MSKKTKWNWIGSSYPRNLMTREERIEYDKQQDKMRKRLFKFGLELNRMPTLKYKEKKKDAAAAS